MKKTFPWLIVLWAFLTPLQIVIVEAFGSALSDRALGLLQYVGLDRARLLAALAPYILPASWSAAALYAAYALGRYERASYEPTPDLDPRLAFERIRSDKKWIAEHTEPDTDRRKTLQSNYLDLRLDSELHAAIAKDRIWVWGSKSLPRSEGPFQRIQAALWDDIEIVFDGSENRTRCYARLRSGGTLTYVGLKFNAKQTAKVFSIKMRKLR